MSSKFRSGSFELEVGLSSNKRPRYEHTETEILHVGTEPTEVETVTIATEEVVPSSQFEIEIGQSDDGESVEQLQASDLGPNFGLVHDTQEIHTLASDGSLPSDMTSEDGSTLNAIGHALIQMQQGGQTTPSSQFMITRSTSSGSESGQNGPLYVMIPPSSSAEILHAMGRPIAPKMGGISNMDYHTADPIVQMQLSGDMAANREAQRKATHNEVERRRRDRINELIKVLAQIVPACQKKDATTGSIVGYVYSKGTVLDKTVDYLKDLMFQNEQLTASAKIAEKSTNALAMLQNQIQVLEKENAFLRAQIIQFGIDAAASSGQKQPNSQQLLNSPLAQSLLNTVATQSPPSTSVSPPAQQTNNVAAQQLLLSLAQNLTNSPLLTSLSQNQAPGSMSSLQLGSVVSSMAPSQTQPSMHLSASSQFSPLLQASLPTGVSNPNTPLLSSLVQTLSSIASTTTSPSIPAPKSSLLSQTNNGGGGVSGGLSAAAAASLLNTLILAQNVLTSNSSAGSPGQDSMSIETVNTSQQ